MKFNANTEPISWLLNRYKEENLDIRPPYQRKPVWAARQKCYLIESILLGFPVPEIYIQETTDDQGRTRYAIVDGQQRVRTVLQFIGVDRDPKETEHNKFLLEKLSVSSTWRNKGFSDLSADEKTTFYAFRFAIRYLDTNDQQEIKEAFQRLNKYLTPLKAQELRNATYEGPFAQLALKLADDDYWARNGIVTSAAIRRMGDVEFISDLLIGIMHGPQGGGSAVLDEYYQQFEDYEDEFPDQSQTITRFKTTLDIIRDLFPTIAETRWSNKTDYYSLFLALAAMLRQGVDPRHHLAKIRKSLEAFSKAVNSYVGDKKSIVPAHARDYALAVEKGSTDKKRRANRHDAITIVLRSATK